MTDQLNREIRRYYEAVIMRMDPDAVPRPVTAQPQRIKRGVAVAGAAAILVAIALAAIPLLLRSEPPVIEEPSLTTTSTPGTTSTSVPSTSTTVPDESAPTTLAPGPIPPSAPQLNPLLAPFFSLEPCGQTAVLAAWMTETMPSAAPIDGLTSLELEQAITVVPLLRSPNAVCVDALGLTPSDGSGIAVSGWHLYDGSGELIARAVGREIDDDAAPLIDDPDLRSAGGEYHQDWMGSGQTLTGWVLDGRIEAGTSVFDTTKREGDPGFVRFVRFVVEIPGYELPTGGRTDGNAGADLVGRLSRAQLAPLTISHLSRLPTSLPPSFVRCWGPYWRGRIPPIAQFGTVTMYCNTVGETIRVGVYQQLDTTQLPAGREDADIAGTPFSAHRAETGHWIVVGIIPAFGGDIIVEAPPTITLNEIVDLLESIPSLDPRLLNPADGTNDLRPLFDEAWLTQILTDSGALNIEIEILPAEAPLDIRASFQLVAGSSVLIEAFYADLADETPLDAPLDANEIRTIEGVDVFIIRGTTSDPAGQAVAYCGGILFNYTLRFAVPFSELPEGFTITGDPVVEALEALLNQVDC
jgi:hypothetical protein